MTVFTKSLESVKLKMAVEAGETLKEIGVRELLTSVYGNILQKYPHVKLPLEKPFESLIADDGDTHSWGRSRQGYMVYENASIVKFGDQKWLMALATKVDGYAGSDYSCDLKAFPLEDVALSREFLDGLRRRVYERYYFQDTILAGSSYGGLIKVDYLNWAPLSPLVAKKLGNLEGLVARPSEMSSGYLSLVKYGAPISWAIKSQMKFKPESVDIVTTAVESAFVEMSSLM